MQSQSSHQKQLVPDTDPFQSEHESATDREDLPDNDNDEMHSSSRRSSSILSRAPTVSTRHGRTTPLSTSHAQREQRTPPSSPHAPPALPPPPPPPPLSSHIQCERSVASPSPSTRSMYARPCSRFTTPSHPTALSSPHSKESLLPPHTYGRLPAAPFCRGHIPGVKPKASDYQDIVEKMLLRAMHEYACLVLSTDAFPNEGRQTQWAETTWRAACEEYGEDYECSVPMIRLVRLFGVIIT